MTGNSSVYPVMTSSDTMVSPFMDALFSVFRMVWDRIAAASRRT